jgi:hypothetical protein
VEINEQPKRQPGHAGHDDAADPHCGLAAERTEDERHTKAQHQIRLRPVDRKVRAEDGAARQENHADAIAAKKAIVAWRGKVAWMRVLSPWTGVRSRRSSGS